jgi:dTDP-4-dehydrorhamnose reductase
VAALRPAIIVNAAAYTAVDQAESEPGPACLVNAEAPEALARAAKELGALLVHYSTDYVFDGEKTGTYREEDPANPLGVYGRTKLEGERAIQASGCEHLIFRTSWVYGARGRNFLLTMMRLARERDELRVVDDQRGAPTWSRMIAETTAQALARRGDGGPSGLYHLSGGGETTWFGFTRAIVETMGLNPRLTPITTADYPLPARRPANSLLCNDRLERDFGLRLPDWRESLRLCLEEMP